MDERRANLMKFQLHTEIAAIPCGDFLQTLSAYQTTSELSEKACPVHRATGMYNAWRRLYAISKPHYFVGCEGEKEISLLQNSSPTSFFSQYHCGVCRTKKSKKTFFFFSKRPCEGLASSGKQ